jgi:hypothetical protein
MASVGKQTDIKWIEHVIVADYVGVGIAGVFARVPEYANAIHGQYVHFLADDDELANSSVVTQLRDFAIAEDYPPIILVSVIKHGLGQISGVWPPVLGEIDLGNLIVRRDVWTQHCGDYGKRYEGDADFAQALCMAGHRVARLSMLFLRGDVRHGHPEVVA